MFHPAPPHFLFVYGTLRRADRTGQVQLLGQTRYLGLGKVEGLLFHLGEYPGAVPAIGSWVLGEVYELEDFDEAIARLDHYEGCDAISAAPHEYQRETAIVCMAQGGELVAWIYWYARETAGLMPVASGDWLEGGSAMPSPGCLD